MNIMKDIPYVMLLFIKVIFLSCNLPVVFIDYTYVKTKLSVDSMFHKEEKYEKSNLGFTHGSFCSGACS